MYRRGIVEEVDAAKHRVRVRFPEKDGVVSGWLDVAVRDTRDDKDYGLPSVGAQVAVIMDERDEAGCVVGSIYSTEDAPDEPRSTDLRRWTSKDGTRITYDRAAHKLRIELAPGGLVEIDGGGSATFVALAELVDARIAAIVTAFNAHVHPTGVGPSGPPPPLASQAPTASAVTKSE